MALLAKSVGTVGAAVAASLLVAAEMFFLADWLLGRDCPLGTAESCAFTGIAALFFGGIAGAETLVGTIAGGAFLAAGKREAAKVAFGALVVVLAGEHAWLLLA
jgi:hypothetical protein